MANYLQSGGRLRPSLEIALYDIQVLFRSGQLEHYSPSLGHHCNIALKRNPPGGQHFEQYTWLFTLPEAEIDRHTFMSYVQ